MITQRMISIDVQVDVPACDGCGAQVEVTPGSVIGAARFGIDGVLTATVQVPDGWSVLHLGGKRADLCPRCTARAVLACRDAARAEAAETVEAEAAETALEAGAVTQGANGPTKARKPRASTPLAADPQSDSK